jgi:hypothetical protein
MRIKKEKHIKCQVKHNNRNGKKCKLKYRVLFVSFMPGYYSLHGKDKDFAKFEGERSLCLFSKNAQKHALQVVGIAFGALAMTFPGEPATAATPARPVTPELCRSDDNSDEDVPNGNVTYSHNLIDILAKRQTLPKPNITMINPLSGPYEGGNEVYFEGVNFANNCTIAWNDIPLKTYLFSRGCFCFAQKYQGKAIVPVYVRNPDRQRSGIEHYTYTNDTASGIGTSVSTPHAAHDFGGIPQQKISLPTLLHFVKFAERRVGYNNSSIELWMSGLTGKIYVGVL